MLKTTWAMPFLSALFWGSCQVNQYGRFSGGDLRAALCGFTGSMFLILALRQIAKACSS